MNDAVGTNLAIFNIGILRGLVADGRLGRLV